MSDEKVLTKEIAEQVLEAQDKAKAEAEEIEKTLAERYGEKAQVLTAHTYQCEKCDAEFELEYDERDYALWQAGELYVQDAFPYLEAWERELMTSLTCDECWQKEFPEELEDEDEVEFWEFTAIEDDAAESLSKYEGRLALSGLTELSDTAAESLSKHEGQLYLAGLTELSDAAAQSLSKRDADNLSINLDNLPESAAQILRDADHEE